MYIIPTIINCVTYRSGLVLVRVLRVLQNRGGEDQPFTFATRDIALRRLDSISDIHVRAADDPYRRAEGGEEPGTYTVEQSTDAMRVTWYYPPLAVVLAVVLAAAVAAPAKVNTTTR